MRPLSFCLLILGTAACSASDSGTLTPTSPEAVAPTTPGRPGPSNIPRGGFTISGLVTERLVGGGARPMAGVSVNAWVDTGGFGYSYWWANGRRQTDGSGRYELTGLPGSAIVMVESWIDGHAYVQQCAAPPIRMEGDTAVDLQLVSRANISASPDGVPLAPGFRFVSGVVFETTPAGRRPVPGVHVDYEPFMDSPAAHTFTDADGRYLLCGIPADKSAEIGAGLNGRPMYATARPGQTTGVDLVFP